MNYFIGLILLYGLIAIPNKNAYSDDINFNDSVKYNSAYNYIIGNKQDIESRFINFSEPLEIFISDEVITFSPNLFKKIIVEYEYPNLNDSLKNLLIDFSGKFISSTSVKFNAPYLFEMNNSKNFNYIVYFSEIIDNKMIAEIRPFREDASMIEIDSAYNILEVKKNIIDYIPLRTISMGEHVEVLFYFKGNDIIKVFITSYLRG